MGYIQTINKQVSKHFTWSIATKSNTLKKTTKTENRNSKLRKYHMALRVVDTLETNSGPEE